jgi:CRISPR/Cas system-associated protein Cas10 (large subunit of type III CRISPR-Cas system)
LEENHIIERRNEECKKMGDKIIETAKEEAQKILNSKYDLMIQANKMLEEVKQYCIGVEKRRFNAVQTKVEEVKALA